MFTFVSTLYSFDKRRKLHLQNLRRLIKASISIRSIPSRGGGRGGNTDDFASCKHGLLATLILTFAKRKLKYDTNVQVEKMITSHKP